MYKSNVLKALLLFQKQLMQIGIVGGLFTPLSKQSRVESGCGGEGNGNRVRKGGRQGRGVATTTLLKAKIPMFAE